MSVPPQTEESALEQFEHDLSAPPAGGGLREHMLAYFLRVRGGDAGSIPALAGILVLIVFFSVLHEGFLTAYNIEALVTQASPVIIMAMGLIFVLLLGEIDLSAGTTGGLTSALMAVLFARQGLPLWLAILAAMVTGLFVGFATGWLRAKVGIPSFVITLATFLGFQGITVILVGGQGAVILPTNSLIVSLEGGDGTFMPIWAGWALLAVIVIGYAAVKIHDTVGRRREGLPATPNAVMLVKIVLLAVLGAAFVYEMDINRNLTNNAFYASSSEGLPYSMLLLAIMFVLWNFVLNRTRYGRHVYAVGGSDEAARRAGISVSRVRISVFIICSGMAALSGLMAASLLESVGSAAGSGNTLLLAVGAAVIGGTSLFGGRGRILDAVLGGLVVEIIQNGMSDLIHGANAGGWEEIVTGVVLLIAAGFDAVSRRTGTRQASSSWRPIVSTLFLVAAGMTVFGGVKNGQPDSWYAFGSAVAYIIVAILLILASRRRGAGAVGEGVAIAVGVIGFASNLTTLNGIQSGDLSGFQAVTLITSLLALAGAVITVIVQYAPVRTVQRSVWLGIGMIGAALYVVSEFLPWASYSGGCCPIQSEGHGWVVVSDILFLLLVAGMALWAGINGRTRWSGGMYLGIALAGLINVKFLQIVYYVGFARGFAKGYGHFDVGMFVLAAGIVVMAVAGLVTIGQAGDEEPAAGAKPELIRQRAA